MPSRFLAPWKIKGSNSRPTLMLLLPLKKAHLVFSSSVFLGIHEIVFARPLPLLLQTGWGQRQADIQAIDLNFRDSGNGILHPQINSRGDGPGFVETEFQFYTYLTSLLLPIESRPEWPRQAMSLLSISLSLTILFLSLNTIFNIALDSHIQTFNDMVTNSNAPLCQDSCSTNIRLFCKQKENF